MAKFTLTNQGYMGLGIYLGYKASYRREEMERHGVNYDEVVAELSKVGIIRSGKINKALGLEAFRERFPDQLGSQTHQYRTALGY